MNHNIITTSSMIQNRNNQSIKGCHPSVETHNHHTVRTLQVLLTAITMLFTLGVQGAWCADVASRSINGNLSTWTFTGTPTTGTTMLDGNIDCGILYKNNSAKNSLKGYLSSTVGAQVYIPVPAGGAGSISMTVNSSSDSRYYQLFINENASEVTNQRLYSKASSNGSVSADGKTGPQTFTFTSSDLTTVDGQTYLKLQAVGGEMKVNSFTVTLTTGMYGAAKQIVSVLGTDVKINGASQNATFVSNEYVNTKAYAYAPTCAIVKTTTYDDESKETEDISVTLNKNGESTYFIGTTTINEVTYTVKVPTKDIATLQAIDASTTWTFNNANTADVSIKDGSNYIVYANEDGWASGFNANALSGYGSYLFYKKNGCANVYGLKFRTAVAGKVTVTFANTGSSNPARTVKINGTIAHETGASGSSEVTTNEIEVAANQDVTILGIQVSDGAAKEISVKSVVFTATDAPAPPTPAYPKTATWNIAANGYIASDILNTTTTLTANDGTPLEMPVDAAKLGAGNGTWSQFNTGTVLKVPVTSINDVVTASIYTDGTRPASYVTIGGTPMISQQDTHKATAEEVKDGYVEVTAAGDTYINSVSVTQQGEYVPSYPVTAKWNFAASDYYSADIEGRIAVLHANEGTPLAIEFVTGKLGVTNGSWCQFNTGTVFKVPVTSTSDVITVRVYTVGRATIGGDATTGNDNEYHVQAADVTRGYVEVAATLDDYIAYIQVVQNAPKAIEVADVTAEESAQNTPQGWTAVSLPNITINTTVTLDDLVEGEDNAAKIQAAIDAANAAGGGKVVIPAGEWLSGQLFIKSNVVLHLSKNCTLKMLPYGTYPAAKANYFIGTGNETVNDVIIEGEDYTSIIDGQGAAWWQLVDEPGYDSDSDPRPAGLVRFRKGTRYLVRNIQFQNSPKPNLVLGESGNASHFTVHDVKIVNPDSETSVATADGFSRNSHNTDGIPVWGPYCNIYKCNISTGDDNVVFDSNSQYCHVWDCDFGRGHGASIGSNTMNVHDILWDNIRFNGTQSGFKIKTDRGKGNELYNITYQNSTMTGVRDILYMDCWYGSSTKPTPGTALEEAAPAKGETTPAWHDITYKNITATDCVYKDSEKNGFPIYFYGLPESHIKNVTIDNVTIEGQKGMFMAYVGENDAQGVTFQNGCSITNVKEPTAAAFVQDYSAVHNDAYVTVPATEKIWNFSNWDIATLTCPTVWDGLAIYPAYDNSGTLKSSVDNNGKSIDGYSFTKRFKFGAKSLTSADQNDEKTGYMKFHVSGPTDIVVYGMSSSSTAGSETTLYLSAIGRTIDGYLAKSDKLGGSIGKLTYSYTGAEGDIYLFCDGNAANIYMIKATPVSAPVDPEPTPVAPEWESIEMTLNAAGLLTAAEISSKETVDFGITIDNGGNVIRVENGAPNAIGSITGNYHSDHGMNPFSMKLNVPGVVKITTGTCSYDSDADLKVNGSSIIDAPFTGDGNNNCWKNNASNVMYGVYDGAAGEITITKGGYTPYIKIETYDPSAEPKADPDGIYDLVVENVKQLKAALTHSGTATEQYKILVKNGTYDLGTDIQTPVKDYVSLIGESRDGVIIQNKPTQEGIQTSVLLLVSGTGTDIENMTLKCTVTPVEGAERSVVIWDKGQNNIFRNLKLVGRQDTYSSDGKPKGAKSYFEDCHIMGTVDFICGSGNVMFENCILDLQQRSSGDVITAPSTDASETGFVFSNCTIQGDSGQNGKYYLARGWKNDPKATFINTTMKIAPASGGVSSSDASSSVNSKTWKEYGSKNASGEAANVTSSVISESDANTIISGVVGTLGTDDATELIELEEPIIEESKLKWKSDTRAIGYVIYKNGTKVATVAASTSSPSKGLRALAATKDMEYDVDDASAAWSVSAINAKGAVGKAVAAPYTPAEHTWDFTNWSEATKTQVLGATDWTAKESDSKDYLEGGKQIRWLGTDPVFDSNKDLTANGTAIEELKGLRHTSLAKYGLGLAFDYQNLKDGNQNNGWGPYHGGSYLWVMGKTSTITIPNVKKGSKFKIGVESHKYLPAGTSEARGFQVLVGGSEVGTTKTTAEYAEFSYDIPGTDGVVDVVLQATKGCHLYWIDAEQGEPVEPTPTVEFEPFKIDFRVKASEEQKYTVTLPESGELPACVTVNNVAWHGNQHGATNGTSLTVHVDGPTKFTIGGCNFGNTVSVKVGSADAVAVDNKTATCDNGGDAIAGLSYNNNVTYNYEGTEAADITFSLGSNAYMPYLFAEAIVKDWTPTWNETASRWEVKQGETDAENGESLKAALDYVKSQTNKTLYIPNGTYDLGETTEETIVKVEAGMHLIGESQKGVVIKNLPKYEGIGITATLKINGANVILENMTIKCRAPYGKTWAKNKDTGIYEEQTSSAERGVCIQDCGNGSHYKNVTLDGLQDTYYSNGAAGMTATFDNCIVRGNVDFFCGNGNITVNNSRLQIVSTHGSGGTAVICAPATYTNGETQGYLFDNCVVEAATSAVDCLVSGHSTNQKFALARAWYNGTDGTDKTPRVTFKDTEFEIKPNENWTTMGPSQPGGAPVFQIINTGVQFSDEAMVIDKTNKPFAYATANDRTNPESISASNITGGGEYDLETIMQKMEAGDGYTPGETKTIDGHKAIVLQSANTVEIIDEKKKETRVPMDAAILNAIYNNDIIVLDGSGTSTDFVLSQYIRLHEVKDKTIVGINGARLCTEWYLTDYFKSLLENVPTSSGTGVNSASTAEGTGGDIHVINNKGVEGDEHIKEEGEYLTRKTLLEATGDKTEAYRNSGIFYIDHSSNLIIRNFKFIGPGSLDCAGYDLMAIIDGTNHCWVDHCEFVDGMDGNFDITNESDFITVSWCKFSYTDRSYAHQNTNLVGSSDDKDGQSHNGSNPNLTDDRGKLNITFAYNEWGANCRARMPMARFGRIHMLNNYYNCAGNSEYAMNPRKDSEFLVEGNYWERGVRRAYNPNGQKAVTWGNNNYYADKAADKAGSNTGDFTVTVPYQYSSIMLDPHKVPEVLTLNGGAKLYQKPYFTTNLGVADNVQEVEPGQEKVAPFQHKAELTEELMEDGLVFSVWAENAHTFQWYKQDIALNGTAGDWQMLEGEQRNTYTFKPVTGVEFNLKCQAFGVSGETTSDVLKVKIDGLAAPYYLGGMPEEMQTVYTGTPMTFTANFKDATGYQWYKNTTNEIVVDDAHKIEDATSNTYTYAPSSAEVFYLYCVASNSNGKGDGYSDIVKVKGIYRDIKFHMYGYFVQEENDGKGKNHIATTGGTTTTANPCEGKDTKCAISENAANNYPGLCFQTGKSDGCNHKEFVAGTYAKFSATNAIAIGDVITIKITQSGSSSPADKYGFYLCTEGTKTEENLVKTISVPNSVAKGLLEVTLTESEVAKLVDKTDFYLIPFVPDYNKKICINEVLVYNGETIPADDPVVTTDVEETKSGKIGTPVTATIVVTDAASYQWYKNTTNEKVVDEEHKIAGATSATLNYTPTAAGTEYIYCVIQGVKSGTSVSTSVMELKVKDRSAYEAGSVTLSWPMIESGNNSLKPDGIIVTGDFENSADVITSQSDAAFGSKLNKGSIKVSKFKEDKDSKYAQFVPQIADNTNLTADNSSVDNDAYLKYTFVTKTEFTPKNISFKIGVDGTNNGCFKAVLKIGSDETVIKDVTAFVNNADVNAPAYSIDLTDVVADPGMEVSLYLYAGGKITNQKSVIVKDVVISGDYLNAPANKCALPTATRGEWIPAEEKWPYTLNTTTESAKIHYTINGGEEQTVDRGTVIKVSPSETFTVWAVDTNTDSETKLVDSKVLSDKGAAMPVLTNPTVTVSNYDVEGKKFTVSVAERTDGATVYYTTDGTTPTASSAVYSTPLSVNPETVVKVIAIKEHYTSSAVVTNTMLTVNSGSAEIVSNKIKNGEGNLVGASFTMKSTYSGGNPNVFPDGCKLNPRDVTSESYKDDDINALGITTGSRITVNPGFVITKIVFEADNNYDPSTAGNESVVSKVFIDGDKDHNKIDANKTVPYDKKVPESPLFVIDNIAAKQTIDFGLTGKQINARITVFYEFDDAPASVTITDSKNSEDVITLAGDELTNFKTNHTYTVNVEKVYAEDPIVKITTEKGYEYFVPAGNIETDGDKLTHFTKSFVGVEYTVKAKVNAVKSPNIEIANDMSLKGGYKVTLTYSKEDGIYPYINVDNTGWVAYDPEKEYFALGTVQSKMMYGSEQSLETVAREADCPSNSYTAGKPFAVYLYVNGYQDNQTGANIYNDQSFGKAEDKIYSAIANQFNVIPLAVNNSDAILEKRPDITDAKLVVITESLGGSGSVEIAGVGNKSNMMALTLKRDVLDKTNVLNLKMFLNGSSAANNQRWQWAQPRAMASELTSIMPCTPDGGGMYEIFGNATMSRDASINLWDDISTENMLYHLQPVFNFNEENETRPQFTPLALVIDPEEPEDEREQYHAIHFYKNGDYQYIGMGLSLNEWKAYNNNVYAIIDKIGEMIKAGKSLDSKLEGIVEPKVTDNGDGSATVMNNNLNADTYYVIYTKSEYDALDSSTPEADDIISGNVAGHTTYHANDTDFRTLKYTEKMYIFAASKLGEDAKSEVVEGTVEGNSIRYVIRENDDPATQGMVAKYPFDLTVNSGTFNMPYNQSWKKDGYTVKAWEVTKSSDPALVGTTIVPGTPVSGLTQDITVKAIWSENTFNITDLSKTENKAARTVTWEFLQSKGAPALSMESKAGNMQAILVGQAKFRRDSEDKEKVTDWIDVPMTINTDNIATLPDNGTEYHGKFNNTSVNWAKILIDGDKEYTGSDYAQVRTGTQFKFPAVYGMNVVYKQVDLVEATGGVANGNVNRSQVSQSYLTDGTKTADVLKKWNFVNPGFQLDANGKVVMTDGVAQLAKTSLMYEQFKAKGQALGLYDEKNGGNHVNGGLIYYTGDGTEATMTSIESAQYIHVGATTGKTLGGLNNGSVFMQSLSVTYPELYDLTCTWNPAKSDLDPEENPGKIEKLNDPRPNCGGRYVLNDDIKLKLTPAYGYYVDVDNDEVKVDDVVTKEAYYFLKNGMSATSALDITDGGNIKNSAIYRYKDAGYADYSDDIKANIPEDGAYITMKVMDIDLVVSMKKLETVKYHVEVEPSTYGYITYNTGNGRPHEDEYDEFPVGKKLYVTAHPNTGYKFKEWRRKGGSGELISTVSIPNITLGDGVMVNPFDKSDYLETNELMFIAGTDNHGYNDSHQDNFTYVAVFEKAVTGTGYYEFDYALLKTEEGQAHSEMEHITVSKEDKNQFPSEFTSELLNFPKYYTLFKPGYTLDHWVEIEGETVDGVFTPTQTDGHYTFGKPYNPGSYYNFATEGEVKHLVPVFKKNPTSYDYRATPVDIKWDLRVAERAQRVNFKSGTSGNTAADTKIYYSTQAIINGDVHIDVPLTITLGKKGKLVNDIEEEDKWCAMGEGTTIVIPSGLGAKFTVASLSKMETTTIDGVVPTSYTVENIDGADVYLYTYTTQSEATSVTLKIGDDYTYYKYIRAELPAADAVPLTTTVNNPAFGTVEIAAARTTADTEDNEALLKKINATRTELKDGQGEAYTLGLGTIVSLHAKRTHLYVLDYFEDGEGNRYSYKAGTLCVTDKDGNDITADATAVDEYLKMEKVQDFNTVISLNDIQLTFQVQSYSESMHAVYKENTLYQVNYTSGEEAEGEAPGMTLVEDGESFTIPAENHHLYLDGQTLRYWMDEDGNKYDLGQSYILGQTFTASKDLPSGIASGNGFTVPKKDIFLTPVFEVNDFTVMNLSTTATAKWPLSRKGTANYDGNGDIVINFEGINGIYVTPLKLENGDFIDLKMDIRGENGKANNVNSTDRCQVNSGTVFGLPSSSNCTFTLNSANSSISAKIDGATVEGQQTVSKDYTGDKTQIDVQFTGNTYLYEVVAQYNPVTTDLPELDYATVGNISLGALGTPLAGVKLSTLKNESEVSGVPADLSNSTTGIMPVVRGTATRGGYVDVIQATIDNPVATMLVKTRDGVTVSVYKIGFDVIYPNIAPRVTDLKIDRKFQCDLKKMYEDAKENLDIDGTNYLNDEAYLRHLGVEGENAENERVAINGVINIKFSTKMAETTIPAATFQANGTGVALGQAVYALEGQTLTFTYKGLAVDTEYDFIIPAGTFKDVFWAESTEENKPNHVYDKPIRIHFTTVETAISTDRRVINYVVTHNQASHFDADQAKMVADGAPVQVASNELIKNLEDAGIEHGTLDRGVELANAYKESGKRFYIFVPDGEYQLMGNDFIKTVSSPIGEDGKIMTLGKTDNVYNGITTVSRDNVSITGQSQEKTIVYNHPVFEGLSNASTLKLNNGIANFYAQDMTLQNRFDFLRCRKVASKGVAPALWDRSAKPIFKNVKFDSYQDTYYTNANNQFDDTRGYAEDCTIMGYVDFVCGDGDHWFQNCDMVVRQGIGSTATNMFAAQHYDTQKWGYVMNHCTFSAENNTAFDVNNGKMTIARPWKNSPAETLIECKFNVLSTDDGYKKMSGTPLVLRMQEYKSYNSDGTILDLSKRSLRNSTPAVGSYDAVMTPSKAAEYNIFDVMGGEDGYDPTLYTAQVNMTSGIKQDDTFLTWDDQKEALCYFIFTSDTENGEYKLFAVTADTEFEMGNEQINKWFCVRAANQRGGLGAPTDAFQYKAHESYKRELVNNTQVIDGWRWSTIYLDFDAKAPIVQHDEMVDGEMKTVDDIYVYALVKVDATKLTFKRVKTMEKDCGYLIKARPRPEEYEFKYTEKTPVYYNGMTVPEYVDYRNKHKENPGEPDIQMPHMSLMNGSVTDKAAAGTAGYTLASKTSYGLGFYKFVGKQYNANYAWLDAALVAEAQKALADGSLDAAAKAGYMLMVFDDDVEEIEDNKNDIVTDLDGIRDYQNDEDVIFNLSGQRINRSQLQRGMVYIINGKKVRY